MSKAAMIMAMAGMGMLASGGATMEITPRSTDAPMLPRDPVPQDRSDKRAQKTRNLRNPWKERAPNKRHRRV